MHPLLKKMRIHPPHRFLCVQTPPGFVQTFDGAADCFFTNNPADNYDSIHWFATTRAELENGFSDVLAKARPGMPVWIYFPKGSSGIQTDLTRDRGWEAVLRHEQLRWINLISFDDTWSGICTRMKTEKDLQLAQKPAETRAIFQYADSATKTITLPDDLAEVLAKHPAEKAFFDNLSFSHRREYVEWIVTAKQESTRQKRLAGAIERLTKGMKNPAGR